MRDTLIPFGDMGRIYARYEQLTGAPVDLEAIKRHHFAACMGNQLQFGAAVAAPDADTDLMTFMQWNSETNLMATDFLGEYLGLDLPEPGVDVEIPAAAHSRDDATWGQLVRALGSVTVDDSEAQHQLRLAFRMARHLHRRSEIGAALDAADLDDVHGLLGRRPADWLEAERELERFVMADADTGRYDAALTRPVPPAPPAHAHGARPGRLVDDPALPVPALRRRPHQRRPALSGARPTSHRSSCSPSVLATATASSGTAATVPLMTPYRARIILPDEPGRLGRAATALSRLGVNILDIDVQSDDGQLWADELLIDFPFTVDPDMIDQALRIAGVELIDLRPADSHEVVDSTVHTLELVQVLAGHGRDRRPARHACGAQHRALRPRVDHPAPGAVAVGCRRDGDDQRRGDTGA